MSRCRELLQRRGVSRASEPLGARDAAPCERARRLSDRALGNPVHSLAQAFRAFGGGRKRRGRSTGRGRGAAEAGRRAGVAGAAGRRGDPCARRGALSPLPPAHGGSSDRVRRFEDPEKIASWGASGPRCDGGGAAGGFRMLSEALPRSLALKAHAQRAGPPSTRAAAALHRIRSGRLKGAGCRRGRPSSTLPVLDPPSSDPRCLCPRKVSCPPGSPFGGARPGRQARRLGALPARGAPDLSANLRPIRSRAPMVSSHWPFSCAPEVDISARPRGLRVRAALCASDPAGRHPGCGRCAKDDPKPRMEGTLRCRSRPT